MDELPFEPDEEYWEEENQLTIDEFIESED
jgi:hypothetical protein